MNFVYKHWETFCKKLSDAGVRSIRAEDVLEGRFSGNYTVLKHDVETDVAKAYRLARMEHTYGHKGSYYVQAYLLTGNNIKLLKAMQSMGHEISYHYDVLDSTKGDMEKALTEYQKNCALFQENGFMCKTVCQHGNPIVERNGYCSNRDFFRNSYVQSLYPDVADIMVDFKTKAHTEYTYFSDAGRRFKLIFDPINNDRVPSDDKNISLDDLNGILPYALKENCIISTHPHRWESSAWRYWFRTAAFKILRAGGKLLAKMPLFRKIMSRYYHLAKKI